MGIPPLVSIVTATYNRSNVLAFAIESVRWQTFQDWELWVIGDACTDDTAQVVSSFRDPRIHFINLTHNVGEQSGPNNAGGQYARGRYLAYLNHDDLWLPDHLTTTVNALDSTGADLVFTLLEAVQRNSTNLLHGVLPISAHEPPVFVPASSWVLRRELLEAVGPWRYYRECYRMPSQDWLFRAWKAKKELHPVPRLTVVAIPSGARKDSYAKREVSEHQLYSDRIRTEPDFRTRELTALGFTNEHDVLLQHRASLRQRPLHTIPKYLAKHLYIQACLLMRIDPLAPYSFLRNARFGLYKGAFIDHLRQVRGLPPLRRKAAKALSTDHLEKNHGITT